MLNLEKEKKRKKMDHHHLLFRIPNFVKIFCWGRRERKLITTKLITSFRIPNFVKGRKKKQKERDAARARSVPAPVSFYI